MRRNGSFTTSKNPDGKSLEELAKEVQEIDRSEGLDSDDIIRIPYTRNKGGFEDDPSKAEKWQSNREEIKKSYEEDVILGDSKQDSKTPMKIPRDVFVISGTEVRNPRVTRIIAEEKSKNGIIGDRRLNAEHRRVDAKNKSISEGSSR